MPDHNAHGVGFKRMRMAGLLPAAALILAVFASSAVSAAEVKLAGAVVSGLFYSKAESAEHSNLVLAGVGEAPDDTCFKILGREDSNVNLLPVFRYLSTIVLGEVEQID